MRSVGYSELLCLSRRDLISALAEYPEAERILEESAKERIIVNKALSKFKEKLQQEPMRSERKDKPRKIRDLYEVVSTPEFKTLVTRQASEMEDLRKVVADLKELGDKVGIAYITSLLMCTTNVFTQLNLIIADFEVTSGKR